MGSRLNVKGERYGLLTAMEPIGPNHAGKQVWRFLCDCGQTVDRVLANVRQFDTKSCGCKRKDGSPRNSSNVKLPVGESSFNGLFTRYRRSATLRGVEWSLSKEEFRALTRRPCSYCGRAPFQRHKTHRLSNGWCVYTGVDRRENHLGYHAANVVPCCFDCNRAKGTLDESYFLSLVGKIAANRGLS
jgi:tRNA(Ile)-lysidine synthase TilS/MesJ